MMIKLYHKEGIVTMGSDCIKENTNIYFQARKNAVLDSVAVSREEAAYQLGVSVSTLSDYERGKTKIVPVDKVVLMADLYNAPELKMNYCKNECPIGRNLPIATHIKGLESVTLRFIKEVDADKISSIRSRLIDIAEDGIIDDYEKPEFEQIINSLDEIAVIINEIKLIGEKVLK